MIAKLELLRMLRHPEVRAERASKDAAEAPTLPGPSPFEARLRRAPQGDGKLACGST